MKSVTITSRGTTRTFDESYIFDRIAIASDSGCWEWAGPNNKVDGRGVVYMGSFGRVFAYRLSHMLFIGPIPQGHFVCHHCDNPPCVNPAHLYAGTAQQNVTDMNLRGRAKKPPLHVGEAQHLARPVGEVLAAKTLRAAGVSGAEIARQIGVPERTVYRWLSGENRGREVAGSP